MMIYFCVLLVSWLLFCELFGFKIRLISWNYYRDWISSIFERKKFNCAQSLIRFLMKLDQSTGRSKNITIPQYKFYSNLVEDLLYYQNQFGAKITKSLMEIRKSLRKDLKNVKLINGIIFGTLYQYCALSLFIWGFIFSAQSILNVGMSREEVLIIVIVQILGLVLFYLGYSSLYRRSFSLIECYLRSIYRFRLLLEVSRPISEAIKISEITTLNNSKGLADLNGRLVLLAEGIKRVGRVSFEEFEACIDEVWDVYEVRLDVFMRHVSTLKIFLILFFVLPCFLYSIFLIMERVTY